MKTNNKNGENNKEIIVENAKSQEDIKQPEKKESGNLKKKLNSDLNKDNDKDQLENISSKDNDKDQLENISSKDNDKDQLENISSEEINKAIKCGCRVVLQHDADKGVSYDILVENDYWIKTQKSTREDCINTLLVPGFRRGHAPQEEIARIVTDDYVLNIAAQTASKHASQVINSNKKVQNIRENDFYVVLVKLSKEEVILNYSFIMRPIVDIRFLEDFKIKLPEKPRVNQSDFQKMVKNQIKSLAGKVVVVKRPVQISDVVNIDFCGCDMEGKKIPNTEGTDYVIEIGSKTFIPGFEDNLIGLNADDKKTFQIAFPKKYFNQKLQGTKVRFDVKVRKISEIIVPKQVDDDLIKSFKIDKVTDLNGFHNHCHQLLMEQANNNWSQQINNITIDAILKEAHLKVDQKIIKSEINAVTHSLAEQARINKLSPEDVAVRSGLNPKNIMGDITEIAKKRVKLTIIIREYIKDKKITLQQKDAQDRYAEYKNNIPKGTDDADILSEQMFVQNMIRNTALKSMIEKIYENSDRLAQTQRRIALEKANAVITKNKKKNNTQSKNSDLGKASEMINQNTEKAMKETSKEAEKQEK